MILKNHHTKLKNQIAHLIRQMKAVDIYLRLKADKQTPTFIRAAKRNSRYVAEALANRPITSYSSSDAAAFRDCLFDKGLALGAENAKIQEKELDLFLAGLEDSN